MMQAERKYGIPLESTNPAIRPGDFKSLADKVEDDDNRAIRKIRVRFSIKKDYFKMPRSFYMQYGNVSYVRSTLLAREILIDYRS